MMDIRLFIIDRKMLIIKYYDYINDNNNDIPITLNNLILLIKSNIIKSGIFIKKKDYNLLLSHTTVCDDWCC